MVIRYVPARTLLLNLRFPVACYGDPRLWYPLAHGAWHISRHIAFPVNCAKALLDEEVTAVIRDTAAAIMDRLPIEREMIGTDRERSHLLCRAHPKMAPGGIGQIFKSFMAREIFRRKPPLNECCGAESVEPTGTIWRR